MQKQQIKVPSRSVGSLGENWASAGRESHFRDDMGCTSPYHKKEE
jgi:hypothetical protein